MTNREQLETIVNTLYYALRDIWFDNDLIKIMIKDALKSQDFLTQLNNEIDQDHGRFLFDINVRKGNKKYLVKVWRHQKEDQQRLSAIEVFSCY